MKNPEFATKLTSPDPEIVREALEDLVSLGFDERLHSAFSKPPEGISITVISGRPEHMKGASMADYRPDLVTLIGHKDDKISGAAFSLIVANFKDGWQSLIDMLVPTEVDVVQDPDLPLGQILVDDAIGNSPRGRSQLTQAKFRLLQSDPQSSAHYVWTALRAKLQLEASSREPASATT